MSKLLKNPPHLMLMEKSKGEMERMGERVRWYERELCDWLDSWVIEIGMAFPLADTLHHEPFAASWPVSPTILFTGYEFLCPSQGPHPHFPLKCRSIIYATKPKNDQEIHDFVIACLQHNHNLTVSHYSHNQNASLFEAKRDSAGRLLFFL